MLNKEGNRELAYVVKIQSITPINGADKVELAHVGGWQVMVTKDKFHVGDLVVYFEIDSKLPKTEQFAFMEKYNYVVKTQKFFKGSVLSQGLIMSTEELKIKKYKEGDFLTKKLNVTLNQPQCDTDDELSKWKKKHTFLSKFKIFNKLAEKRVNRKKEKKITIQRAEWPYWVVKTDEERCQNIPQLFISPFNKLKWIATEKIDGTPVTFTMKQGIGKDKQRQLIVCSRNLVIEEENMYTTIANQYNIEKLLNKILDDEPTFEYVTLQGEIYGFGVQTRNYNTDRKLAVFNFIYKEIGKEAKRYNPIEMKTEIDCYNEELGLNIQCVPVLDVHFVIPNSCEELLKIAEGNSAIDNEIREGLVIRSYDGKQSFKVVSNAYLSNKKYGE